VADAAEGFSAMAGGLRHVLAHAQCRRMGGDQPSSAPQSAGEGRKGPGPACCHHRQPEREDRSKRGQRGYDGGKKIKGRKRHIATDTQGNLLTVVAHSCGISDTRGCHLVLIRLFILLPHLLKIFVDGGYKKGVIDWAKAMFGYVLEVVKRPDIPKFVLLPKRWVVERTFGWFNWHRRLSKDFEHSPKSSEAMVYIASISIMLKKLHPL
jgi:transposase